MVINKGLPTNFKLDNGKFQLIGGEDKVDDDVYFFMSFFGFFRIFTEDFTNNVYVLFQRNFNEVRRRKGLLLSNIIDSFAKYIQNAVLEQSDIGVEKVLYGTREKGVGITLQYRPYLNKVSQSKVVKFIKIL